MGATNVVNYLSNHDHRRVMVELGNRGIVGEAAFKRVKLGAVFKFFLVVAIATNISHHISIEAIVPTAIHRAIKISNRWIFGNVFGNINKRLHACMFFSLIHNPV